MVFIMAKSTNNNTQPLPEEEDGQEDFTPYRDEIVLIMILLVSLFSLISIIGIGGMAGGWFRNFVFGTFGILGYLFPFVLFFSAVFILSNYKNRKVLYKILCCIGIYFVLAGLFQLLFYTDSNLSITEAYIQSAKTTLGGGFIGAVLTVPLCSVVGTAGTYIILFAILLILLTFATSRFLLSALGKSGEKKIRKMHQQYQAERTEKNVIKESYGKLPPRKRRPSVTFDLNEEDISVPEPDLMTVPISKSSSKPISITFDSTDAELSPATKKKKTSKKAAKEAEMQEYEPVIDETAPITQNSSEIRMGLEQSLPIAEPLERTPVPPGPPIRFVDASERKDYTRKKVSEPEESYRINPIADSEKLPAADTAVDFIDYSSQKTSETHPLDKKETISDSVAFPSIEREPVQEYEPVKQTKPIRQPVAEVFENPSENMPSHRLESADQAPLFPNGNFERFTKEKKFDGSVLEGSSEQESTRLQVNPDDTLAGYIFPPINLLAAPSGTRTGMSANEIKATTERLRQTFESFKVRVTFGNVSCGPAVTRYEIQPEQGVKVSKITGLADDIKLNLAAADIRIEAPIPGKAAIGIEVPNRETAPVMLRELLECESFQKHKSSIAFAVGKDISGQPMITDIAKMPHLLIAGATGSGKSVCINTLIMSILYKSHPDDVKLIMVDPKVVELSVYNGIPHLLIPVVTDPKKASAALNWAVTEMTERYEKFAALGVRDLSGYNKKIAEAAAVSGAESETYRKLPQIVIIVDELADLMMVAPGEVEDAICRLAQMARAAGLHLVIATQRPSVNVITGVIKANVPSRIAFSVSSAVDSRTIIDGAGAEKLLGKGDMLFFPSGLPKPVRVQGAFVSDTEVSRVVEFLREQNKTQDYDTKISDKIAASSMPSGASDAPERDDYFMEAGKFIIEKDKASIGMLQRVYKIGFNRAARIMDQLADAGVVGPEEGTKPRKVLMTMDEFEQYLEEYL